MNSIFDENSEFLKYLKQKENNSSDGQTNPNLEPKTPSSNINDTFVLDLKSHQLKNADLVEEVPVQKHSPRTQDTPANLASQKKISKINSLKKNIKHSSSLDFVFDKLKFLLVSGLIFLITFIGINWSAYSKIFHNWYLNISGYTTSSPLNQFTDSNSDTAIATDLELVDNTDIPKLNFEITPPGTRVIIPRLNTNVPVISMSTNTLISRNWDALEADIQNALRSGVVHYPGTPFPNQSGNVVLTGHSSYYPWDPGRFKDVFAVLHQATVGDEVVVFYNQKKFTYQITDIKKVMPTEVNVLGDTGDDRLTLITCTPIGTDLQRLIVTAKPIQ
jgi:LPXTG-site transpeptidase (sortase) family protein